MSYEPPTGNRARPRRQRCSAARCTAALIALLVTVPPSTVAAENPAVAAVSRRAITALGRLEPRGGVIRLSGPSRAAAVISELRVEKGDVVEKGQPIAILDTFKPNEAARDGVAVDLRHAASELDRLNHLYARKVVAESEREKWATQVGRLQADLRRAEVELDQSIVRAPIRGRVLEIHAHEGEKVGPEGIVELGNVDEMYAIAEVYETDIGLVRSGQRATVTSAALSKPLHGTVERIGLKIGKLDATATDPLAPVDARVVEVEIRLQESDAASALTYLQVEVAIEP